MEELEKELETYKGLFHSERSRAQTLAVKLFEDRSDMDHEIEKLQQDILKLQEVIKLQTEHHATELGEMKEHVGELNQQLSHLDAELAGLRVTKAQAEAYAHNSCEESLTNTPHISEQVQLHSGMQHQKVRPKGVFPKPYKS